MDFLKCSINGKVYGNSPYEAELSKSAQEASEKGKEKKGIDEGGALHTPHLDEGGVDIEEADVRLVFYFTCSFFFLFLFLFLPLFQAFIFEDKELLHDVSDKSNEAVGDFFRLLALCNTVLVDKPEDRTYSESEPDEDVSFRESSAVELADRNKIKYQAASPDEAALVSAAQRLGFELIVSNFLCYYFSS